ncbi:hypothetical protein V7S43_007796 [Phytophthora oleae]|uniref:FLYWCH-type domain-containing protein n=1 Tax=Phytophthora oleae TaxID=2107226 RepID=A0ABD3FK77_9STRA
MAACMAIHSKASPSTVATPTNTPEAPASNSPAAARVPTLVTSPPTPATVNPPKILRAATPVKLTKVTAAEQPTLGEAPATSTASTSDTSTATPTAVVAESANTTTATVTTVSMLPTTPPQSELMPPLIPASTVAVEEWLETPDNATAVEAAVVVELPPPEEEEDLDQSNHRVAQHKAKTVITMNGYPFTRYHKSGIKHSYRCSSFRTSQCKVKVHFIVAATRYDLVGEHTCNRRLTQDRPPPTLAPTCATPLTSWP